MTTTTISDYIDIHPEFTVQVLRREQIVKTFSTELTCKFIGFIPTFLISLEGPVTDAAIARAVQSYIYHKFT